MAETQQRYHVIERIDAGGMAEVFKANSTSLQGFEKLVAIKRILPKLAKNERFIRMFLDEAKLSLHLSHTNCVQVFDLGLADGTYFIVMEFVDGVNLKHVIEESRAKRRSIPVEQAVYVALEICKGLAHAHKKKDQKGNHLAIVHRDISPPNILISNEGEVKITDFGLAKAKSQVETTDPGVVKGKFGYLSPEAAHGEDVDARTDIFAVGILLWEMLTGTRLFLGDTDLDTLQQVRTNAVPPLSKYRKDVPSAIEEVVLRALETDIATRYQTIEELGRELAKRMFQHGKPVTAFDIAEWVRSIRDAQPKPARSQRDKAVEAAIQDAVNRIVTLEEVDDLDRFMAEQYHSFPDQGVDLDGPAGGDFVDPRMWADMGFSDMDMAVKEPETSDAWEETNVTELIRMRQTSQGGVPTARPGGPPSLPDERTVELSDMDGRVRADALRLAQQMNAEAELRAAAAAPVRDSVSQAMAQVQQVPEVDDFDRLVANAKPQTPAPAQAAGPAQAAAPAQATAPASDASEKGGLPVWIMIVMVLLAVVALIVAAVVVLK